MAIPLPRLSISVLLPVHTTLQSALCVPLRGREGVAGVLTLYHREKNCFTKDHLRLLLAASSKLGLSVENALQYRTSSKHRQHRLSHWPAQRQIDLSPSGKRTLARAARQNIR